MINLNGACCFVKKVNVITSCYEVNSQVGKTACAYTMTNTAMFNAIF